MRALTSEAKARFALPRSPRAHPRFWEETQCAPCVAPSRRIAPPERASAGPRRIPARRGAKGDSPHTRPGECSQIQGPLSARAVGDLRAARFPWGPPGASASLAQAWRAPLSQSPETRVGARGLLTTAKGRFLENAWRFLCENGIFGIERPRALGKRRLEASRKDGGPLH